MSASICSAVRLTGDMQSQTEPRNVGSERDFKTVGGQERLEDVAHDVDLVLLASLVLLPDDRIVEHVELVRAELAEQLQRLAGVEHQHLVVGQHRHRTTCTCSANQSPVHSTRREGVIHYHHTSHLTQPRLTSAQRTLFYPNCTCALWLVAATVNWVALQPLISSDEMKWGQLRWGWVRRDLWYEHSLRLAVYRIVHIHQLFNILMTSLTQTVDHWINYV